MTHQDQPALVATKAGIRRINQTFTSAAEQRLLIWMCARLPRSITSDILTALGIFGAILTFLGFVLSGNSRHWLWLVIAGVVFNWLGDSLDGTLARYRNLERPRYGFFLDHMADTFVMALMAIGVGLSPFAQLSSGLMILAAYYLMVILTMTTCVVTGNFKISFAGCGPTEIRLLIIAGTLATMFIPMAQFSVLGIALTAWDILLITLAVALVFTCASQVIGTLIKLEKEDPAPEAPHPKAINLRVKTKDHAT